MANTVIQLADVDVDNYGNVIEKTKPSVIYTGDSLDNVGVPSSASPETRGDIENTGIQTANENKKHACDTTIYIDRAVAFAKATGGQLVIAIRNAIRAVLKALGINPGSNGLIEFLKKIKETADELTEWLKEIQNDINAFLTSVQKIQALIAYILSLPAQLVKYFLTCIKEAYAELSAGFLEIVGELGNVGTDESKALSDSLKAAYSSVKTAVGTAVKTATTAAALPATTVGTLLSPGTTTVEQQQAAAKEAGILFNSYSSEKTFAKP